MCDEKPLNSEISDDLREYLTISNLEVNFPIKLLTIRNTEDKMLFELLQHNDGSVTSTMSSQDEIGEAATLFFDTVVKNAQNYALSQLKQEGE